ncbi:right-handed parallel beta-helix repeat-containing protein [Mucilaginibacter paludis]|uniref:S-layer domain-containing protein n=1 Tax=Mucilaginibacter paludis DSM 18603 TaxID=714943 RepID=H1Y8T7_9SPHI|nr:right-handed parallel beta-helix repeat-containing protein [Mucilaginibacter paludis]EHQ28703.1 S-layer domain-containing protein [Mucilaginibacter paludis DSM 18603]
MKSLLLFLLLLSANHLFATRFYVSSGKGNEKFNGLSPYQPKKNIQDAANLTKPGDTVFVMDGTYLNPCKTCNVLDIPKSGKNGKYVVYINYPGEHPKIKFNGWAGISVKNGVSYVKITGFEIIGNNARVTLRKALTQPKSCANPKGTFDPAYNGNAIVIESTKNRHSHHIIVSKNIIHDCGGGGIGVSHADYITVEENIVYNTSWYTVFGTSAISFYQFWNYDRTSGYHNFIRRNKCYNNKALVPWIKMCKIYDGNGIIVDDFRNKQNGSKLKEYQGRTLIENNICWFNGGTGIHAFQSDHIDIINNTAYCNSRNKEFNPGQILSGLGNDVKIINNILVADSVSVINSNYLNTNLIYQNNLHYNITFPDKAKAGISTSSCITGVNPAFINPANNLYANFKLQPKSPAVRRANVTTYSKVDFEGRRRRVEQPTDIGAYQQY